MNICVKDLATAADVRELTEEEMADIKGGWLKVLAAVITIVKAADEVTDGAILAPSSMITPYLKQK